MVSRGISTANILRGIARAMYEQLVRNLNALRVERLRTEVAWDDHELVAFFGRMGLMTVPRLVLDADLSR